jgi:hypothetical protein
MAMGGACRTIAAVGCLLASLCAWAQDSGGPRRIVLPNPQLIHCWSAECSQLWKQDSNDGGAVYPAQVLTDFVNGEVVGLTAVYDKSVSTEELRAAVNTLYAKSALAGLAGLWRVDSEQLAISVFDGSNGAKEIIYLKIGTYASHVPSAHLDCPTKKFKKPWFLP